MALKEKKKKHDDAHFPLGGKGKKANRNCKPITVRMCSDCGNYPALATHLCSAKHDPSERYGK